MLPRQQILMHVDARARLLGALPNFARHLCCPQDGWFKLPSTLTQADTAIISAYEEAEKIYRMTIRCNLGAWRCRYNFSQFLTGADAIL